ncbi:hypothetical protein DZC31_30335 (plasmid) [Stenotrophomonas rhizophila]|uniref:hypothetical protein n=1 Tax=Pseudomonas monteilii TaxID=76759 RepID=UPI000E333FB4|nr:hypothetical protein [Pseudomonas monteilii]AXQ51009.1 hypothetical protein DZC31_30335 [Stenotrophomonas rhizophila]MBA6106014.1 hypothetical protein [Pseudomonas monteilii]
MTKQLLQPICGTDLERWRLENGLSKVAAADAFGLQKAKWEELTSPERSTAPISDPAVALCLYAYKNFPESSPVEHPPSIKEFFEELGFDADSPQDLEMFATLTGRSASSAYRLIKHDGKPGRPIVRWIEAVRRLNMTSKQSQKFMRDAVSTVADHQGVEKVLIQGWTKNGESSEHE